MTLAVKQHVKEQLCLSYIACSSEIYTCVACLGFFHFVHLVFTITPGNGMQKLKTIYFLPLLLYNFITVIL